jgi:hypothetical protein
VIATPCLTIYGDKDPDHKEMLCAPSISEKELWMQAILKSRNK